MLLAGCLAVTCLFDFADSPQNAPISDIIAPEVETSPTAYELEVEGQKYVSVPGEPRAPKREVIVISPEMMAEMEQKKQARMPESK